MRLGRLATLELTPDEAVALGYHMLGTEELRRLGIDNDRIRSAVNSDTHSMNSFREKLRQSLKAFGAGAADKAKADKDAIWKTIHEASKG